MFVGYLYAPYRVSPFPRTATMDPLLTGVISAVALVVGALITAVMPRKGSLDSARIAALMADNTAIRAELASQAERLAAAEEARQEEAVARRLAEEVAHQERIKVLLWRNHHLVIMQGVENGSIPPWPPLPPQLENPDD